MKLFPTWEVDKVLTLVKEWGLPEDMDLAQLTRKTLFLLALVSSKRVKALFNLSIAPGLVEFSAESVRFNPVRLDKQNRPSYLMQPLKVRRFEDRALDPVRHLEIYVRRTKSLRTSTSLFVITRKPYSAAARGTLARWLTEVISASG